MNTKMFFSIRKLIIHTVDMYNIERMMPEHTCYLHPQCRWPTGVLPHQSSWQTGLDQLLLPVVQDFSPHPGFDPSHTAVNTKSRYVIKSVKPNLIKNTSENVNEKLLTIKLNVDK